MTPRATGLIPPLGALTLGALALGACQTAPTPHSGLLSRYDDLAEPGDSLRAVVRQRRDDAASDAVERVFLEPARLAPGVGENLSENDRAAVLGEVDRQICYEVSERFTLTEARDDRTAFVRTFVVRVDPTHPFGSGVSAAANFLNPIPVLNVRAPGSTGGLAVESELMAPDGRTQIAAITWGRNATVIGNDSPSLSRVGDALQFAEPMGDAVGDAYASKAREVRDIPEPDPCLRHGPRNNVGRSVGGFAAGLVTGLYVPEIERPSTPKTPPEETPTTP